MSYKTPIIDYDKCTLCLSCITACQHNAIELQTHCMCNNKQVAIIESECIGCGECYDACPVGAIDY